MPGTIAVLARCGSNWTSHIGPKRHRLPAAARSCSHFAVFCLLVARFSECSVGRLSHIWQKPPSWLNVHSHFGQKGRCCSQCSCFPSRENGIVRGGCAWFRWGIGARGDAWAGGGSISALRLTSDLTLSRSSPRGRLACAASNVLLIRRNAVSHTFTEPQLFPSLRTYDPK